MFSFENDIKSTKWQTMVRLYGRIMCSSRKSIATSLGRSLEILISQGGGSQMPTFLKRERGEGYSNPKTLRVNPHRTCEVSGGNSLILRGSEVTCSHSLLSEIRGKWEQATSSIWESGYGGEESQKGRKVIWLKEFFTEFPTFTCSICTHFFYLFIKILSYRPSVCRSVCQSICLSVYLGFEALNTKRTRGLLGLSGLRPPAPRQQSWGPTCNFHSVILSIISHQYNSTRDRARYNEVNLHSCLKQSRSKYRTTPKVISIRWRSAIGRIVTTILCHGRVR